MKIYILLSLISFLIIITAIPGVTLAQEQTPVVYEQGRNLFGSDKYRIYELEFKNALLVDVIRVLAEQSGTNIIATSEANKKNITIYLKDVTVKEAVESICRINGLWYRKDDDNGTFRIMTVDEYRKDLVVYKSDKVRVFRLLNPNVRIVAQAIEDLYGPRVQLSLGLDPAQEQEFITTGGGVGSRFGSGSNRNNRNNRDNRNNRNNRNNSGFGAFGSGSNRGGIGAGGNQTDFESQVATELSVDQIEAVTTGDTRVSADALQDFTVQSSPIYVTVNNEHNMIIVRTSDNEIIDSIADLIHQMDKPVPQVLLEMKVLDILIGDDFRSLNNFAVDVGESDVPDPVNGGLFPTSSFLLGNFPLEGGTFVYEFISERVRAILEILIANNRINVLSKPIVLASNNRPAELFVGEETVITTGINTESITNQTNTTSFIEAETELRQVGNRITITPFINADDSITLALEQETSSVNANGASVIVQNGLGGVTEVPIDTVNTATLNGTVVAKHGFTMAVGGLIRDSKSNSTQKVPVLGDIPIVGSLFRREEQGDEHRELVLLVTPYVMHKGQDYEEITRKRITDNSQYSAWDTEEVPPDFIKPQQRRPNTLERDIRIFENNPIRPDDAASHLPPQAVPGMSGSKPGQHVGSGPIVGLIEAAAAQTKPDGAVNVSVNPDIPAPLFADRKLIANPVYSWEKEGLYVTRVTVRNISNRITEIKPNELRGNWISASFDAEILAPDAETTGYLVSNSNFNVSITRTPGSKEIKQVIVQ